MPRRRVPEGIREESVKTSLVDLYRPLPRTSKASQGLTVAIGRWAGYGNRFEVALGQEAVVAARAVADEAEARGSESMGAVRVIPLKLDDQDMAELAAPASPDASGADWAMAMGVLLKAGVPVLLAGRILGHRQKAEASRLAKISRLPRHLLEGARKKRMGLNHLRWMAEMPIHKATDLLEDLAGRPTVAFLKKVAGAGTKKKPRTGPDASSLSTALPSPGSSKSESAAAKTNDPGDAFAEWPSENERISQMLGSASRALWDGEAEAGELRVSCSNAETLIGVLETLIATTRGKEAPGGNRPREVVIPFHSLDELAYLVGGEER